MTPPCISVGRPGYLRRALIAWWPSIRFPGRIATGIAPIPRGVGRLGVSKDSAGVSARMTQRRRGLPTVRSPGSLGLGQWATFDRLAEHWAIIGWGEHPETRIGHQVLSAPTPGSMVVAVFDNREPDGRHQVALEAHLELHFEILGKSDPYTTAWIARFCPVPGPLGIEHAFMGVCAQVVLAQGCLLRRRAHG